MKTLTSLSLQGLLLALAVLLGTQGLMAQGKIDPDLAAKLAQSRSSKETVSGILMLEDQVDAVTLQTQFSILPSSTRQERHEKTVRALQEKAKKTQAHVLARLKSMPGVKAVESLWIVNAILIKAQPSVFYEMSTATELEGLYLDYPIELIKPKEEGTGKAPKAAGGEPGLKNINAHLLWAEGITGAGRIVSNMDTGVDGTHPALSSRWRGNQSGVTPQEAWFDPLTNTNAPFDSGSHGTHTMGTITGKAGTDIIGVAHDAQWISAGVIDRGGIDATIQNALLAMQWSADPDGNPSTVDDVPDVSSNSWGIPRAYKPQCDQTFWQAIDNLEAATVVVVFAAGNEGPSAQSLRTPADRNTSPLNSFCVGALDTDGQTIANYSSRGPSGCSGNNRIKPEVTARGSAVRSCIPGGNYAAYSGTSMATPHVAGAVALLRQVNPNATVAQIKNALINSAVDLGASGEDNNYGHGRIDVYAASKLLAPTCPVNISITQNVNSSQVYNASNSITASSVIAPGATVTFNAGKQVRLNPGFKASPSGSNRFTAKTGPCPTAASKGEGIASKPESQQNEIAVSDSEKMAIFPNPSEGKIQVKYTFLKGQHYTIKIYDFNGKLVADKKVKGEGMGSISFDLAHLSNGLFTLQLILPDGKSEVSRVMITK